MGKLQSRAVIWHRLGGSFEQVDVRCDMLYMVCGMRKCKEEHRCCLASVVEVIRVIERGMARSVTSILGFGANPELEA